MLDYLALAVPGIWVFDPQKQRAWEIKDKGTWVSSPGSGHVRLISGPIEIDPAEIFALAAE